MDDMEEADETLMRLWRRGQEDIKELRRRLEGTGRKGPQLRPRYKLYRRFLQKFDITGGKISNLLWGKGENDTVPPLVHKATKYIEDVYSNA